MAMVHLKKKRLLHFNSGDSTLVLSYKFNLSSGFEIIYLFLCMDWLKYNL